MTARFTRALKLSAAVALVVLGVALVTLAPDWSIDKLDAGLGHLVNGGKAAGHWLSHLVNKITQ